MKKRLLLTLLMLNTLLAQEQIQVYTCYGNDHQLMVEGRILDERAFKEPSAKDAWFKNVWHKLGQLVNSEIKNAPMTLQIGENTYFSKSDDEGYFEFDIEQKEHILINRQSIQLFLDNKTLSTSCSALILEDKKQLGIISDFDDTVMVSGVTHKLDLINNTFFKNYKQREVVEGMAERFKKILSVNESNVTTPLFFITGSPKQLENSIHDFLDFHHFPARTVITKKLHGKNADALFDQITYKQKKIESLIRLYPKVQWVLFGDSGEEDEKIYRLVFKNYSAHIKAIFIRNVESGKVLELKRYRDFLEPLKSYL